MQPFFIKKELIKINNYPLQSGQKRPQTSNELINERIRFPEVLLIGPNGEQLGKMSSRQALEEASKLELDLYCVAPNANPPVCKILDYGKFRFEQQKKAKENKKKQKIIEVKEVQLTPQIGQHDLLVKVKAAIKFLQDGNKVKVGVRYRGRQLAHVEVGEDVMNKFIGYLDEYATVEKPPLMEGRWLNAILNSKIKK